MHSSGGEEIRNDIEEGPPPGLPASSGMSRAPVTPAVPAPIAMPPNYRGLELIDEDDGDGPLPSNGELEESTAGDDCCEKRNENPWRRKVEVEQIEDCECGLTAETDWCLDDKDEKKRDRRTPNEDSVRSYPPFAVTTAAGENLVPNNLEHSRRRGFPGGEGFAHGNGDTRVPTFSELSAATPSPDQQDPIVLHVPDAYLVEERSDEYEVVVATRPLPWWNQRCAKFAFCSSVTVITSLSIALGINLSKDGALPELVSKATGATAASVSDYASLWHCSALSLVLFIITCACPCSWKQRLMMYVLGAFVTVIAAMAIALGIALSGDEQTPPEEEQSPITVATPSGPDAPPESAVPPQGFELSAIPLWHCAVLSLLCFTFACPWSKLRQVPYFLMRKIGRRIHHE